MARHTVDHVLQLAQRSTRSHGLPIWDQVPEDLGHRVLPLVFLVLFAGGFVPAFVNLLAINAADTILHLVSALLTSYLGFIAPRQVAVARSRT